MSLQRVYKSLWRVVVVLARWPVRGWLRRRCLARIALLEYELFPEWFGYTRMNPAVALSTNVQMVMPYGSAWQQELLLEQEAAFESAALARIALKRQTGRTSDRVW